MVAKSGHDRQCCRRFDKDSNQQVLRNMLTTLKIELLETTHKQVSIKLIVARSIQNELMGERKSTPAARGVNPSIGHMNTVKNCREKVMRERAEPREGSFGHVGEFEKSGKQVEKVVTHELKKVEKVVTHEQKHVEKIVTHAH